VGEERHLVGFLNYRRVLTLCGTVALCALCNSMPPAQSDDSPTLLKRRVTDHWQTSPSSTLAVVWSLDRKNPLLLHCDQGNGLDLMIAPEKSSPGEKGHYPVTIVFDHKTTITQT
jgi:hypothetical protein